MSSARLDSNMTPKQPKYGFADVCVAIVSGQP
jgi:hypothetical protein